MRSASHSLGPVTSSRASFGLPPSAFVTFTQMCSVLCLFPQLLASMSARVSHLCPCACPPGGGAFFDYTFPLLVVLYMHLEQIIVSSIVNISPPYNSRLLNVYQRFVCMSYFCALTNILNFKSNLSSSTLNTTARSEHGPLWIQQKALGFDFKILESGVTLTNVWARQRVYVLGVHSTVTTRLMILRFRRPWSRE